MQQQFIRHTENICEYLKLFLSLLKLSLILYFHWANYFFLPSWFLKTSWWHSTKNLFTAPQERTICNIAPLLKTLDASFSGGCIHWYLQLEIHIEQTGPAALSCTVGDVKASNLSKHSLCKSVAVIHYFDFILFHWQNMIYHIRFKV